MSWDVGPVAANYLCRSSQLSRSPTMAHQTGAGHLAETGSAARAQFLGDGG